MENTYFLEIVQHWYLSPIVNKETGENKRVYFQVKENDFDKAIELAKEKLNFDFEDKTIIDFASENTYKVWEFNDIINFNQFLMEFYTGESLIMLDGTIINR